jgi:hypothetical protein
MADPGRVDVSALATNPKARVMRHESRFACDVARNSHPIRPNAG